MMKMNDSKSNKVNAVPGGASKYKLSDLKKWFSDFLDQTIAARSLSETCRNYYDGEQWTAAELAELEKRKQPAMVINRIAPKINFVLGVEIETRVDPHAYPRTPAHDDTSEAVTDALRYVCDSENFDELRTSVNEDLIIEGYGGVITEVECCNGKPEIRLRYIPWDRIFYDPYSKKPDFSDAKYVGVVNWWDYDDALDDDVYGKRPDVLEGASHNNSGDNYDETFEDKPRWVDDSRNRIRIIEVYWFEKGTYWVAHYCSGGFLVDPMPLDDFDDQGKAFSRVQLVSAFTARNMDNARYGIVKHLLSPQDGINKSRSKVTHQSTMRQIAFEDTALDDVENTRAELARPDGAVKLNQGALRDGSFQILPNNDQTQAHMALMQDSKSEIDQIGPDAALVASDQRQMSGRLFIAKQNAGNKELGRVFDNLRNWQVRVFNTIWSFVRKNWDYEKWLRIRDSEEKSGYRFVAVNRRMSRNERAREMIEEKDVPFDSAMFQLGVEKPVMEQLLAESQQQAQSIVQQQVQQAQQVRAQVAMQQGQQPQPPQEIPQEALAQMTQQVFQKLLEQSEVMQQEYIENDIAQIEVDIRLDAVPETSIVRQEQFSDLVSLAKNGVQIPPDLLIEASDLRNKSKIIKQMTEPDPAQQQAMQQQQQMQMQMVQGQMQKLNAEVQLMAAKAQSTQIDAQVKQMDAQQSQVETQISTQMAPLEAEKIESETQRNNAQAMKLAAEAGEKTNMPLDGI